MTAALVVAVITGWTAAIAAWVLGAPLWLGLVLLPAVGGPVLVLGAVLAAFPPRRRRAHEAAGQPVRP